jgi:serine/threonine-protein kinase
MATPEVPAPVRLGRYELVARLASGGMGEIFLARLGGAAGFEKLLVVKRILPHLADDARFRSMLIAEARLASRMTHANICQVYELGETDGQLYIAMEYLEGLGLLPLLRKASRDNVELDFGFIGGVVQQCTEALHYAHELRDLEGELLGIVHRDVNPGNMFITEAGVAKLLDFGIAKVKNASAHTQTGAVKGKYAYMAPEQLRGSATIDRRADVFAVGVVLYEMLALRRLFQRKTDYLTFRAVMEQPIPDVRRYRPDAPREISDVLARALDRDPDRRPATARQLGTSIVEALARVQRPWSQAEISDFLRVRFADEIDRRRAEIAKAVQASSVSAGRASVSALGTAGATGEGGAPDDEEDGFPEVDSEVADGALDERTTAEFGGGAARPIEIEAGSAASSEYGAEPETAPPHAALPQTPLPHAAVPRSAADVPPSMVVVHKRGLLWPLLAIAMVGITATALFLVWKQRQQPETIVLTQEPRSDTPAPTGGPAEAESGGQAPAVTPGGARNPPPRPSSPRPPAPAPAPAPEPPPPLTPVPRPSSDPYTAVINAHRPQMNRCVNENPLPAGSAKVNVKVKILVEPSGKPRGITFEPGTLDGTAAGECIKGALSSASFPSDKDVRTVAFRIWI